MQVPPGPPAPGGVTQDTSIGCRRGFKASSRAGLSVQGLVLPGPSSCADSVGFRRVPCAVPSSPCTRAMWLLTQRVQEEGTTPRCPAVPEDGAGGLVLVSQGLLLGEALPTQLSCRPRPLLALPALLVFCGFLTSPWLSTWAVTPPGMWRGTLSEVRKKRARPSSTQRWCQRRQQC